MAHRTRRRRDERQAAAFPPHQTVTLPLSCFPLAQMQQILKSCRRNPSFSSFPAAELQTLLLKRQQEIKKCKPRLHRRAQPCWTGASNTYYEIFRVSSWALGCIHNGSHFCTRPPPRRRRAARLQHTMREVLQVKQTEEERRGGRAERGSQ